MKKLYHKGSNNQVHPSPSQTTIDHQFSLSYLPTTILTLASALSLQDKEVLAYLLSCYSSTTPFHFDLISNKSSKTHLSKNNQPHPPSFSCYCFTCYTYYWALWDSSPNGQLIHEIIDAFEDNLVSQKKKNKKHNHSLSKREKRKNNNNNNKGILLSLEDCKIKDNIKVVNDEGSNGLVRVNPEFGRVDSVEEVDGQGCDESGDKQGSNVRKIVSFIGERIWGSVWG